MKKRTLFFLSVCAVALNGYVVHADSLEAPSQLVTVPNLPGTGGQLTVVEEAGQMKAILSNITGEIVGVTGQFKSETNIGKTIAFTIDASGQYMAYLDRSSFSDEDRTFTLALTVNLIDGSAHNLDDYSFNWVKVAENTDDDSDLIENTSATEASKPVSSGTVVDSVEKDSSSSASETQSSSTANSSLAATVTDSSNATTASTLTSTQTTSSVGSQLRSASLMRIATNSGTQTSAVTKASQIDQTLELKYTGSINSGEVIKFAVWSDENGQDDIVWYNADQTGAAYADLRKHRDYGKYNIHTYVNRNGKMVYLNEIVVDVKASGTVTISNVDSQTGSFDVTISNITAPRGLTKVYVPTWTEAGGQDDIKWYEANRQSDGSYKLTVNKVNHKSEVGNYQVHVYYRGEDGSMTGIGATTVNMPELKASGTVTAINVNDQDGSYEVKISNVIAPKGLNKVYVPTWTEAGDQDDIVWHEAERQSDGSYLAKITKSEHKNGTGKYISHVYYQGLEGTLTAIGATSITLPELKTSGTVTAINVNDQAGSYEVKISNVVAPKGLYKVFVPTWTETGGQDDIVWHEAQLQSDGTYLAKITKSEHKNGSGIYVSHVYYRMLDGSMLAVGGTQIELPSARSYTIYIDPGHGGVDSGASYGGVYEKNLALSVANKLKANLIQLGYQVLMTRTADYNVDFKTERSKMANQSNADLFISIHFNATGLPSSNSTGIETYWYQYDPEYQPKINAAMHNDPTRLAESEILANQVQASLISGTGAVNRGVRRETFAVLRETAIPAILVELGFMDNPSDLQKIKEDAYQTKLANALAQGIDNWYGAVGSKPTSGTSTQKKSTEQSQMTTSQQSFFNNILPAIQQVSQKNSIVTSVMLAQSILESGWGTSQLATNAYNIFGIKADSSWKGNTYTVHTKEVVNGKTITVEKQFRAYKSLLESISDYGSFFTSTAWRTKNYASFLQATNYETALTSLLVSGYATDPAYAEKLKSLIQQYGLDQYD
ncbi:GBS Bsp-like repeat-containing protein [Streptococcus parasuis]|uniref:GBS Bsp-like repeat-containing protein n=1 Tax=Streptococcus parasuis TaxID=1501662 RepID=UPI0028AB7D4C|nr:GBS Bsp-like repeat-containing protein [Streptococcus parasuis]